MIDMVNSFYTLSSKISIISTYRQTYEIILGILTKHKSEYITVNNVHTVVEGVLSKEYRKATNDSFMALPDGKPLSVFAKLKGEKNISRIFGPTFFEKTLEWGQKDGLKHYFFGSSTQTLDKMKTEILAKFPSTIIPCTYSPPYRQFTPKENEFFIDQMNKSGADIFWIGLGAPRQEIWMYENYKKLRKGIMIGIGAGFDYFAGNTKHAPEWMKNNSLEWLYRLYQEPQRLWKRYLVTNTLFLIFITLELLGLKKFDN